MENIVSLIDNIKEKITSNEYKQIMDSLKKVHDKKDSLYEITYIHKKIRSVKNEFDDKNHNPTMKFYEIIKRKVFDYNQCDSETQLEINRLVLETKQIFDRSHRLAGDYLVPFYFRFNQTYFPHIEINFSNEEDPLIFDTVNVITDINQILFIEKV